MEALESAALHAAIDLMLQRSVIALVDQQKTQLRSAAETELKFLSFLSHDLNNNLNNVILLLQAHGQDLARAGGFEKAIKSLDRARQSIHDTVNGMRRMLEQERLRKAGKVLTRSPVDMHSLATKITEQFCAKRIPKELYSSWRCWLGR